MVAGMSRDEEDGAGAEEEEGAEKRGTEEEEEEEGSAGAMEVGRCGLGKRSRMRWTIAGVLV